MKYIFLCTYEYAIRFAREGFKYVIQHQKITINQYMESAWGEKKAEMLHRPI